MSGTVVSDQPPSTPATPAGLSTGDKVRFVLRGIGQTLITAGLVVLLFVVYEVWITNIFSERENHRIASVLQQEWQKGDDPLLQANLPGAKDSTIPVGTGIANLYMPRLGADFHWTIVEGTSQDDLAKGPGHYPGTQLPGAKGNFAVAGHRVGKGSPFLNIDRLQPGDAIIIETQSFWYVYRVKGTENGLTRNDTDGVPGRQVVNPSDGDVLFPLPNHRSVLPADATERLLTLTTCHPKFTAENRMIVYAALDTKAPRTGSTMPAGVKALYQQVTG